MQLQFKKQRAFALLYAVLTTSLVLYISTAIINIGLKEFTLSSTGRDSQFAFYAADAGAECALYWDLIGMGGVGVFATSTAYIPPSIDILCNGKDIKSDWIVAIDPDQPSSMVTTFTLSKSVNDLYCAEVKVIKNSVGPKVETTIESRGRNSCASVGRKVERGLRVSY